MHAHACIHNYCLIFYGFQIKQVAANVTSVRKQVLKSYEDKLEELNICK